MPTADGSVIILAELDDKETQQELNKLVEKIDKMHDKLNKKTAEKSSIEEQLAKAGAAADETKRKIEELNAASVNGKMRPEDKVQLKELQEQYRLQTSEMTKLSNAHTHVSSEIEKINSELGEAETKAGELTRQLAAARSPAGQVANLTRQMNERMDRFGKRLKEVTKSVFIFSVLSKALSAMKDGLAEAVMANQQAASSVAALKGALSGLAGTIVSAAMPAILGIIRWVTWLVNGINSLISRIFGVNKGLATTAKNTGGVGGAAKETNKELEKTLASFDEINKLSEPQADAGGGGGGGGMELPPADFEIDAETEQRYKDILWTALAIGAALAAWKIGSGFALSLQQCAGLAMAAYGAVFLLKNAIDAWVNGVSWENLIGILVSAGLLTAGLALAFGKVGGAVGLLITGITLVILALHDWIETGELTDEALTALEIGIMAIGGAIAIFTGSWIPLIVAAIVALVMFIIAKWDEIKSAIENLLDWIDQKTNGKLSRLTDSIRYTIDAIENIARGLINTVKNLIEGDWAGAWESFKSVIATAIGYAIQRVQNLWGAISDAFNAIKNLFSWGGGGNYYTGNNVNVPRTPAGAPRAAYSAVQLRNVPALARGAVIPPNREFMAVLGDQRNGTNLEAPEGLIRAIVREESGAAILRQILEAVRECAERDINMDGVKVGELVTSYQRRVQRATGG